MKKTKKKGIAKKKTEKEVMPKKKAITETKIKKKEEPKEDLKIRFSQAIFVEFVFNKLDFPYELREDLIKSLMRKIKDLSMAKGGVTIIISSARLW